MSYISIFRKDTGGANINRFYGLSKERLHINFISLIFSEFSNIMWVSADLRKWVYYKKIAYLLRKNKYKNFINIFPKKISYALLWHIENKHGLDFLL